MGFYEFKGGNRHSFRGHHEDPCFWCRGYISRGFKYVYTAKNQEDHYIETPFCSPKCYHESIEKGHPEIGYYERTVESFLNNGGLEDWTKSFNEQRIAAEIQREKDFKESQGERIRELITSIIIVVVIGGGFIALFIWYLSKM